MQPLEVSHMPEGGVAARHGPGQQARPLFSKVIFTRSQKALLLAALATLTLILMLAPAMAQTPPNYVISYANTDPTFSDKQIDVYTYWGSYLGTLNSTQSTVTIPIVNGSLPSITIMVKPTPSSWLDNPLNALELMTNTIPFYIGVLLVVLVVFGFLATCCIVLTYLVIGAVKGWR
jgi:hypothetical protein